MGNVGKRLCALATSIYITMLFQGLGAAADTALARNDKKMAELPKNLEAALSDGVAVLSSSRIQYSIRSERPSPDKNRRANRVNMGTEECVVDRGRWYFREEIHSGNRELAPPVIREATYDGHVLIMGSRRGFTESKDAENKNRGGRSSLTKFLGDNFNDPRVNTEMTNVHYLEAIGYPVPETIGAWRTTKLHSYVQWCLSVGNLVNVSQNGSVWVLELEIPDQPLLRAREADLDAIAQTMPNAPPEALDGFLDRYRVARTLTPIRKVTLRLNSELQFALEYREERTHEGEIIRITECSNFSSHENDRLWLPKTCLIRDFFRLPHLLSSHSDKPVAIRTMTLEKALFNTPGETSFALDYGPGQIVGDRSTKEAADEPRGRLVYRSPASLDPVGKSVKTVSKGWHLWSILAIANAIFLAGILAFFGRRWFYR